jgi:bifunctional DNA-binding transcriptional regulator/antitoxin component of YhaV-PrlF toxin-antitoxin module
MRTAIIVSVTEDRQLELPPELQAKLNPGDEYMIWETEDSILFKKIQKPLQFSELRRRVEALGPDPEQPTLEEISEMVREVRRQNASE